MKTRSSKSRQKRSYNLRSISAPHEDSNNHILTQPVAKPQQITNSNSQDLLNRDESGTLKLETLPLEIIRHVASHSSCKAVLALRRVCRVLHHTCSDIFIMKHILDRSVNRSLDSAQHLRPAWYDGALSPTSSFSSWARYALAHENMEKLIKDVEAKHVKGQLRWKSIASCLPQLLALQYPMEARNQADLHQHLLSELQGQSINPLTEQVISFCLAVLEMASPSLIPFFIDRLQLNSFWQHGNDVRITRAQLVVTGFRFVLEDHRGRYLFFPHQLKISQPTSDNIPFSFMMKLPVPFLMSSVKNFGTCHLQTATSQAFLVGDEWEGYYGHGQSVDKLDAPMRGIVFERYTQRYKRILLASLEARGTDIHGEFTLSGTINGVNGKMSLCKQYINGGSFQCSGVMTPFGIVGNWHGRSGMTRYGGLFWLWKAKWTHSTKSRLAIDYT